MCGLFGFLTYGDKVPTGLSMLTEYLAKAASIRGTDATGLSYVVNGKVEIDKKAESAYKFRYFLPLNTRSVVGHTRKTTQGSASDNFNNHPFKGKAGDTVFSFAHNGVLWNDGDLQRTERLPSTKIKTDSYVPVQILEKLGRLSLQSCKEMAEMIEGSFSFTMLDEHGNVWIVKNDSPLTIAHIPVLGMYVYASTEKILFRALMDWSLTEAIILNTFSTGQVGMELIQPNAGDILCIGAGGTIEMSKFSPRQRSYNRTGYQHRDWDDVYWYSQGAGRGVSSHSASTSAKTSAPAPVVTTPAPATASVTKTETTTTEVKTEVKTETKQTTLVMPLPNGEIAQVTPEAAANLISQAAARKETPSANTNRVANFLRDGEGDPNYSSTRDVPFDEDAEYLKHLRANANNNYGVNPEDFDALLEWGYSVQQIEDGLLDNSIYKMISDLKAYFARVH